MERGQGQIAFEAELLDHPGLRSARVGLLSLVGSHAHGLAGHESDRDYRGFYVAPTESFLGLTSPPAQIELKEPDLVVWEIGKFCRMALNCNPNALEALWASPLVVDASGRRLREVRSSFLSERARSAYGGYAFSQLKKLKSFEERRPERREKLARHMLRLFAQGRALLETGELELSVRDPAELRHQAASPMDELIERFEILDAEFNQIETVLPAEPDFDAVDQLLLEIRLEALSS